MSRAAGPRRDSHVAVALVAMAGIALAAFACQLAREAARQQALMEFRRLAEERIHGLARAAASGVEALRSIRAFYAASREVEREEFRQFTEPLFAQRLSIRGFAWIPRVPRDQRQAHEAAARADGFSDYRITEELEPGVMVGAADRAEHFPVFYLEPYQGNELAFGFDLASSPERAAAMAQARDTGRIVVTEPLRFVRTADQPIGIVAFLPVYRNGQPVETVEQRRQHLVGFVSSGFQVDEFVAEALEELGAAGLTLRVDPWEAPRGDRPIYVYPAGAWRRADELPASQASLSVSGQIEFVERRWTVTCVAPASLVRVGRLEGWTAALAVLLFAGLLGAYLRAVLTREARVERLVVERTAELSRLNEGLQREVRQRQLLQQQSQEHAVVLRRSNEALEEQRRQMMMLLEEVRASKANVDAQNQEMARREVVMQSLLEDLNAAKERIDEQASTLRSANLKLQELASLKDEFVAKVSHELRTPLTSIKEGLSLLLDRALGGITPEQEEFIRTMDEDIDRLSELINNMLDISKIEAGRMRLSRARLELPRLVQSLIRSYQPIIGSRRVGMEVGPALPPVFGDSNRLLQVFTNFLSNALKFTPEDGAITFRLERRQDMVAVAIQDTGPGIDADDLPKLFQKFSQVGTPRPGGGRMRGTGLGLVVCKELTELHGGRIEVASAIGSGTTFTVLLPPYTDRTALAESLREQLELGAPSDGEAATLIAVDAAAALENGLAPEARPAALAQLAKQARQHLHRGDIVLPVEPSWLVIIAVTDEPGIGAIASRLRDQLEAGGALRFGAAVHERDGEDAEALFRRATSPEARLALPPKPAGADSTARGTRA
jgi:signal transduction histidine kinase/CHASE1-domain containing sensor protein